MSKRKAEVNDIVLEIDSDDLESSSTEDEIDVVLNDPPEKSKRKCVETEKIIEIVDIQSSDDEAVPTSNVPECLKNGETSVPSGHNHAHHIDLHDYDAISSKRIDVGDSVYTEKCYSDDIVVDSSSSSCSDSSSSAMIGCENKQPVISVRFRDNKIAKTYKSEIKRFMLKMIKLHDKQNLAGSDTDTDLELDIWPEELESKDNNENNDLFFIDDCPNDEVEPIVPQYSQNSLILTSTPESTPSSPKFVRKGPICFNCEGNHAIKDCQLPKNSVKIAENRKALQSYVKVGRYHLEDEQRLGHMAPGRLSANLRYALSLAREDVPLHIYRMRMLGYPPGWFEEAKISHSGITMFDSAGKATADPDQEEGELEPKNKDRYDIKKIVDYPGFNVPLSSRYKERGGEYGFPPMSPLDSKLNFLKVITPVAMMAYKRKKLTLFPSGSPQHSVEGEAEMELDDGEEVIEFPSLPPLPDAEPELPPPPPSEDQNTKTDPQDQPTEKLSEDNTKINSKANENKEENSKNDQNEVTKKPTEDNTKIDSKVTENKEENGEKDQNEVTENECEAVEISNDDKRNSQDDSSGPRSPSLTDLEEKRKALLNSLAEDSNAQNDDTPVKSGNEIKSNNVTPQNSKGQVKSTLFGTPMLNSASKYKSLPSDDKFSKDICDIINFENLPNSTGKYEKICTLLKKVKSEVDRIHES